MLVKLPGKLVVCNSRLLSIKCGVLYGIVAYYLELHACPSKTSREPREDHKNLRQKRLCVCVCHVLAGWV